MPENKIASKVCPSTEIGVLWRFASQFIDRNEVRFILQKVSGLDRTQLIAHPEKELTQATLEEFCTLINRRINEEPLEYLLEETSFYGLDFIVSPSVLIPRMDTEVLVNIGIEKYNEYSQSKKEVRILDLGTGSGIVAIMLALKCTHAKVSAIDISSKALAVAKLNAARHQARISFVEGSWFSPLENSEKFEIIVSNPPYIAEGDPHLALNGLPFEPQLALTDLVKGGKGLFCIEQIISNAHDHLEPQGWLLIEHGYDQAVDVQKLFREFGFDHVQSWQDTAQIERVTGGQYIK